MYSPAQFAENRIELLHAFIRQNPLAVLVSHDSTSLEATHVPMVLDAQPEPHGLLRCHLARANPQWRMLASSPSVLVVFRGAQHYITPSWYATTKEHGKVVPTWNYIAVHVYGQARLIEEQAGLLRHLRELTDQSEAAFARPWSVDDAPKDYIHALSTAIVGIEISIARIEGKWKASQNRPIADRQGVIEGLETLGSPQSLEMAEIVKERL
jgi:transcriptional regulator